MRERKNIEAHEERKGRASDGSPHALSFSLPFLPCLSPFMTSISGVVQQQQYTTAVHSTLYKCRRTPRTPPSQLAAAVYSRE